MTALDLRGDNLANFFEPVGLFRSYSYFLWQNSCLLKDIQRDYINIRMKALHVCFMIVDPRFGLGTSQICAVMNCC